MSFTLRLRAVAGLVALASTWLVSAGSADAALVVRTISGTVITVSGSGLSIAPGAAVGGSVVYDDALIDEGEMFSTVYLGAGAAPGSSLTFTFPGLTLTQADDGAFDEGYPEIVFHFREVLGIGLEASGITAFGSATPLRFATGPGEFAFGVGSMPLIQGTYTLSEAVLTPLPPAFAALGVGLLGLVGLAHRRK